LAKRRAMPSPWADVSFDHSLIDWFKLIFMIFLDDFFERLEKHRTDNTQCLRVELLPRSEQRKSAKILILLTLECFAHLTLFPGY
jgi:hypothetical protein